MKKIIAATVITAGLAFALTACAGSDTVAKVGKEKISRETAYEELMSEFGREYLNHKIDYMLLSQEVEITENEIKTAINDLKELNKVKNVEELSEKLGIGEDKLLETLERNILEQKVLAKKVNLKEEEIKQRYEESKYKILLNYMPFDDKVSAEKALSLVRQGETLENAVHKVKEDYYLSFAWEKEVSEGELQENVLMAIMNLENGKVSEVLTGEDGKYYLYEVKGRNEYPYSQEKGRIIAELAAEKGKNMNDIYLELREKHNVEYKDNVSKELMKEN